MLKLADYFQPLNFYTLSGFVLTFLVFDIVGFGIHELVAGKKGTRILPRITFWMLGMGIFVFLWFVLGFYIEPQITPLLSSMGILLVLALPSYIIRQQWKDLIVSLWDLRLPILLVLPFLPAVFVKASLPPYYSDEMAYHFIAPVSLAHQLKSFWTFNGGVLMNAPRLMDTFYIIVFSIFKTYSVARLFHFVIMVSSALGVYKIIKRHFGQLSSFLFMVIFMGMTEGKILTSTLGYVDVATYSFFMVAFSLTIDFLLKQRPASLVLSSMFWGMSVGSKYTPLTSLGVLIIVVAFLLIRKRRVLEKVFSFKTILMVILLFFAFGGYWYIKNFVIYGNPIYPFLFDCWGRYATDCPAGSSFFGSWTTSVTLKNFPLIIKELLRRNPILHLALVTAPFLQLFNKNKKSRLVFILAAASFLLELLILKFFSGFSVRYQTHQQILLIFILVTIVANNYKKQFVKAFSYLLVVALVISTLLFYAKSVKKANSLGFVNWEEINYSTGKTDIYHWIDFRFPRMKETIYWCESQEELSPLARFDPDLIWYEYDGFMRSFLTNCYYKNPQVDGIPLEKVLDRAKSREMQFWIATPNSCVKPEEVKTRRKGEDERMLYLRQLNNLIVCNSEERLPNLYYFDYKRLD